MTTTYAHAYTALNGGYASTVKVTHTDGTVTTARSTTQLEAQASRVAKVEMS